MKHIPTENLKYFFEFIEARQQVFWNKLKGITPVTENPLLQTYKFTNTYRSLDRVSQYLIQNVIYNGKSYTREDMFWRILIFRHFNLPETWKYLLGILGDINSKTTLNDLLDALEGHQGKIYNNAYMLTASFMQNETFKHKYGLLSGMRKYELYLRIYYKYYTKKRILRTITSYTVEDLYAELLKVPAIAEFIAMQVVDDLMWSEIFDFPDNTFIRVSLGSFRGITRCFTMKGSSDEDYAEVIHWVYDNFDELCQQYGCNFIPIPNRPLGLMDIQNCFCETDKYMRGLNIQTNKVHGKRIKQRYIPSINRIEKYVFPPKWNVSEIQSDIQVINPNLLF